VIDMSEYGDYAYRMVATLVYYGLTLTAGQLAGNFYVNNFISGLMDMFGVTSAYFTSQK